MDRKLRISEVNLVAKIKAVLFDMHGTLVYNDNNVTDVEISGYLLSKGYEVSPQQLRAAWAFVSFVDYPEYGYKNWYSFFTRIFWRLRVKVDNETLYTIIELLQSRPYQLYSDAATSVRKAKKNGFKTAAVTTIAYFQFEKAIEPIRDCFDFIMTGYEAGCDKANPKMYRKVLEVLNVKPEETFMIGDDIEIDVLLPKRLGINAILLNREGKIKEEYSQADAVASNLNEAVQIIIRRSSRS